MSPSRFAARANAQESAVLDLPKAAAELEEAHPLETLRWACERFAPRLSLATAFGPEGCVLIDLVGRHHLPVDIFTLDTGLLFPETHILWRRLEERYGLTIRGVGPQQTLEEQALVHGPSLWERHPEGCCELRKVVPLRRALAEADAWITGIRREQTPQRRAAQVVERDDKFGLVKLNPLVTWGSKDVWSYLVANGVPYNPMHDQFFPSIGCQPCTSPVRPGEDARSGRWRGREKTECGLHVADDRTPPLRVLGSAD